jgi:Fe/S biogenesis protein NfuA
MSDMTALLTITEPAAQTILDVRAGEPAPETLALWLEVTGVQGTAYTYDLYFRAAAEAQEGDAVEESSGVTVVVPARDVEKIAGSTLDVNGGGMVLQNPNVPEPPAPFDLPESDLSSPVAQRILEILETQINPAIAGHGGYAQLVAVEEPVAYLLMGGGCQGCGMAAATMSQGIETAILEAVPEITSIVDVTDHASGANPYYASHGH